LEKILLIHPLDGVVLLTGCDKTTPSDGCCHHRFEEVRMFLTQTSQNIPAICLNVGTIINGYVKDDLVGLGMIVWKGRELYAAGDREELFDLVSKGFVRQAFKLASRAPPVGHCNTMGTASIMNALAEALGIHDIF